MSDEAIPESDRAPGAPHPRETREIHGQPAALAAVEAAGGEVTAAIFAFPGGRRFHFRDPSGNELAVWSEG